MKKRIKYILLMSLLLTFPKISPLVAATSSYEGEELKIIYLMGIIMFALRVAVPVILLIAGITDLIKAMTSNDEKDMKKIVTKLITKVVLAASVFLLPTLVVIILKMTNKESLWNEYSKCLLTPRDCDVELWPEKPIGPIESSSSSSEYSSSSSSEYSSSSSQPIDPQDDEIFPGTKYDVSEEDLQFLANVGYCEQGNNMAGIKAEITLATNRYELKKSKYSSVVDYVKRSGWFACAKTTKVAGPDAVEAVRDVVVKGNRTLPIYIDEHDCFNCNKSLCDNGNRGDICKLVTDGKTYESMDYIKNRGNYVKNRTVIYNKYGGVYTFYSFPCKSCDPFGYTKSAYDKYN